MANEHTREGLKPTIGVSALAISIINGIVGAGIFALPAIVGMQLGSYAVLAYLFCSIMMAAVMLCYAEIGSRIKTSGGSYAYVQAAFGNFTGYIINWLFFFGWNVLGSAAIANIIADFLAVLFPVLLNPFARAALFFVMISLMVIINIRGVKQGMGLVKVLTIIKLIPLFGIIIFGFGYVNTGNLAWQNLPSINTFSGATLTLFYAFAGFETCLGVSGEIKDHKRTVPRGIILGGLIVMLLYMLLQTVTQGVLGAGMASFKDAPLAAVAERIVGPVGASILLVAGAISCFGNISADIMCTPRALFAGANNGMFPKLLGRVHPKFATPYIAVAIYGALIFIFSISGGFKQLAVLASAAILLVYLAVILATVKLRRKKEAVSPAFKAPGGLVLPFIGIAAIIWLLTSLNRWEILSTVIFIATVILMYCITPRMQDNDELIVPEDIGLQPEATEGH